MSRAAAARLGPSWTYGPLQGSPKRPVEADDFEEFAETPPRIEGDACVEDHQDTGMLDRLLSNIIEQPQPTMSSPSTGSSRVLLRASSSISALLDSSRRPHSKLAKHGYHRPPRSPRSARSTAAAPAGDKELLDRAMAFVLEGAKVRMFSTADSGDSGDSGCEILGVRHTGKRPTPNPVRAARGLSHSPAMHLSRSRARRVVATRRAASVPAG